MATTVKHENRFKARLYAENTAIEDRRREIEAAYMERGTRKSVTPPRPYATRIQVRRWMMENSAGYDNATQLAEGANAALNLPNDALDQETHWIWDEAFSIFYE